MVTTAALGLLVAVLLVAAYARLWMAIATAVLAMLIFNVFFLPPVGKLSIEDPQNLLAFVAFVSAALIASQVVSAVRTRAREAQYLSERKAAEQQAEFTSSLLASLSHDLRTPLTAIQVALTNLDDHSLSAELRREQGRLAQSELQRLSRLFRDILEMARIDSAALAPEREWVTGADIIDGALANLHPVLEGRPLIIDGDEQRVALIDPRITSSALFHLVENAAQYSPAGTPIELKGFVDQEGLYLSVTDHGPGLDPAELPHVFERFFRGRREHARPAGTGMGLAITRGLLSVEQGRVWAENMPTGGARFAIFVPARSRPVTGEA